MFNHEPWIKQSLITGDPVSRGRARARYTCTCVLHVRACTHVSVYIATIDFQMAIIYRRVSGSRGWHYTASLRWVPSSINKRLDHLYRISSYHRLSIDREIGSILLSTYGLGDLDSIGKSIREFGIRDHPTKNQCCVLSKIHNHAVHVLLDK